MDNPGTFSMGLLKFMFPELGTHRKADLIIGNFAKEGDKWKYSVRDGHFEATFRSSKRQADGKSKESWTFLRKGQFTDLKEGDELEFRVTSNSPADTYYVALAIEGFTP